MAETVTPAPDVSGIERTTDGTIVDGQTTQTDQSSSQTTTPSTTEAKPTKTEPDPRSLLNRTEPAKTEVKKDGEPKADAKTDGAPETYADYNMPDGWTLDPGVKAKADALFKDLNLTQDQAQKAVDLYRDLATEAFEQPFTQYREMVDGWATEAEAHPDLKGKLGPGQEVNVRIGKFLNGLPDQQLATDFRNLMDLTGAGNHPAFIRVIDYAAKLFTEGGHVRGNGPTKDSQSAPGSAPPSAAAALWGHLPSSADRR